MRIALIVLQVIFSILLIVSILLQPSKTQGFVGMSVTNSDSFYSKNKGRTYESMLIKVTIVSAIIFFATTFAINLLK